MQISAVCGAPHEARSTLCPLSLGISRPSNSRAAHFYLPFRFVYFPLLNSTFHPSLVSHVYLVPVRLELCPPRTHTDRRTLLADRINNTHLDTEWASEGGRMIPAESLN